MRKDGDALVKNADVAMHTAKTCGKNRNAFGPPESNDGGERRLRLVNALYRAHERGGFVRYGQRSGAVADAEGAVFGTVNGTRLASKPVHMVVLAGEDCR